MSTKTTKTLEEKKAAKAAYDKKRREPKRAQNQDRAMTKVKTAAEKAADRAAVIAERAQVARPTPLAHPSAGIPAALKATAGTHGRPAVKAVVHQDSTDQLTVGEVERVRQPTVASVARQMIKAGQTDEATFTELERQFHVGGEKKYYPSWYRAQLVRQGAITKAFADEHRHNKTA